MKEGSDIQPRHGLTDLENIEKAFLSIGAVVQ